jgi:hypothetical protein
MISNTINRIWEFASINLCFFNIYLGDYLNDILICVCNKQNYLASFRLPSLESSNFYYDATCLNNWFFKYKTKDNLIYISFLSVILSCLIYVICVRLHSFVVSNTYLRYLCSFAFICGIQHLFTLFVFVCIHLWYPTLIYVICVRLHSFLVSNTLQIT